MIKIKINGGLYLSDSGFSVLETCEALGIVIPRFCYHELLSVSGNCRLCLVEIENTEKCLASCVTEIDDNMSIWVDSPFVKKSRENVIEFLLLNHPLDCPICDQAGECDLQDEVKSFGSKYSRNFIAKLTSEDKFCGFLIRMVMTRCIKCTRCVRYSSEIVGISFFGTLNRGGNTEIGGYVDSIFESEISANVIDLCPVGALTSKPYSFYSRNWEGLFENAVDISDAYGSSLYLYIRKSLIVRVYPKNSLTEFSSIISDKARYTYDSINFNRLKNSKIANFSSYKKTENYPIVIDQQLNMEAAFFLKKLENIDSKISIHDINQVFNSSNFYLKYEFLKKKSITKLYLFLGTNIAKESPVVNAQIRSFLKDEQSLSFGLLGVYKQNLYYQTIFFSTSQVFNIFEGKDLTLSSLLINSYNSLLFIGESFKSRVSNSDFLIRFVFLLFPNIAVVSIYNSINSNGLKLLNFKKNINKISKKSSVIFYNIDTESSCKRYLKDKTYIQGDYYTPFKSLGFGRVTNLHPISSVFESTNSYFTMLNKLKVNYNLNRTKQGNILDLHILRNREQDLYIGNINLDFPLAFKFLLFKNIKNENNLTLVNFYKKNVMLFLKKKYIFFKVYYKYPLKTLIKNYKMTGIYNKNSLTLQLQNFFIKQKSKIKFY